MSNLRRASMRSSLFALVLHACVGPASSSEPPSPQQDAMSGPSVTGAAVDAAARALDASALTGSDARTDVQEAQPALDAGLQAAGVDGSVSVPSARLNLVLPELWTLLDASTDPFDDRPAVVDCLAASVAPEILSAERVLGVETAFCNYLTAVQPTVREIAPGEIIKVRLWHFELSAPEPAEAHAVLAIDGVEVLNERIPIPQPGGLIVKQARAERAVPTGAPVFFHLHNHGGNSWALVEVSAGL